AGVGFGSGSTGTAMVDGAGTMLAASDRIEIGGGASGRLTVGTGGSVTATNAIHINSTGTLDLTGGSISTVTTTIAGALIGEGTVAAAVSNAGTISPGHSAGTLTINGSYSQTNAGALNIELGGLTAG